jgi:hypothetical protein
VLTQGMDHTALEGGQSAHVNRLGQCSGVLSCQVPDRPVRIGRPSGPTFSNISDMFQMDNIAITCTVDRPRVHRRCATCT